MHLESPSGSWTVLDPSLQSTTRSAACVTSNIQAVVSYNVHDSVAPEQRSAVLRIRFAITTPGCGFFETSPAFYTCATEQAGSHTNAGVVVTIGPNSPDLFWGGANLEPGTYGLWISSSTHFLFNIDTDKPWTQVASITVVDAGDPCVGFPPPPGGGNPHATGITTVPEAASAVGGQVISDSAQLTGATDAAGGTITFRLYDGASVLQYTSTVPVSGPGTYRSGEYTLPTVTGTESWHWTAEYSGDNGSDASSSGDESVAVTPANRTISASDQGTGTDVVDDAVAPPPGIARYSPSDGSLEKFVKTCP